MSKRTSNPTILGRLTDEARKEEAILWRLYNFSVFPSVLARLRVFIDVLTNECDLAIVINAYLTIGPEFQLRKAVAMDKCTSIDCLRLWHLGEMGYTKHNGAQKLTVKGRNK